MLRGFEFRVQGPGLRGEGGGGRRTGQTERKLAEGGWRVVEGCEGVWACRLESFRVRVGVSPTARRHEHLLSELNDDYLGNKPCDLATEPEQPSEPDPKPYALNPILYTVTLNPKP